MKKIIYINLILIALFLVSPWFIYENFYYSGMPDFYVNYLIYFMVLGALFLLFFNIRFAIKMRNTERKVAIFFIIPPALIFTYFVLGYFAFSGFTGF